MTTRRFTADGDLLFIAVRPGADGDCPPAAVRPKRSLRCPVGSPRCTPPSPTSLAWADDGSALIVTADDNGRGPIFRVDIETGGIAALTEDDHTYTDAHPAASGVIYALRNSYSAPAHSVRIVADGTPLRS